MIPLADQPAALWKARRDRVDGVMGSYGTLGWRPHHSRRLVSRLTTSNGSKTLDELKRFHAQRGSRRDIQPSLAAIPLTIAQLGSSFDWGDSSRRPAGRPVLESVSGRKWMQSVQWYGRCAKPPLNWAKAEAGLVGPDFLLSPISTLQFPPAPPLTLLAWLATNDERRSRKTHAQARIDQEIGTITAHQQVVGEAEASTIADFAGCAH